MAPSPKPPAASPPPNQIPIQRGGMTVAAGTSSDIGILEALRLVESFSTIPITNRIADLEFDLQSKKRSDIVEQLLKESIDRNLVQASFQVKRAAAQINVIIHAVGILVSLPHILAEDETVESLSLGAGNTGREFDLITDQRVAEFKFIEWQGGSESIRQNSLFYDFFTLAEHESNRKRFLYLLGTDEALRFLKGNRSLKSVFSKNRKISDEFATRHNNQFKVVSDYFKAKRDRVEIVDLQKLIPTIWGAVA